MHSSLEFVSPRVVERTEGRCGMFVCTMYEACIFLCMVEEISTIQICVSQRASAVFRPSARFEGV